MVDTEIRPFGWHKFFQMDYDDFFADCRLPTEIIDDIYSFYKYPPLPFSVYTLQGILITGLSLYPGFPGNQHPRKHQNGEIEGAGAVVNKFWTRKLVF